MPPGGYPAGLAEPGARSVQEVGDRGRRVTFTWFDPPFRPEPPHSDQAYGICFTGTGMIVPGACDAGGERYRNLPGGRVEPQSSQSAHRAASSSGGSSWALSCSVFACVVAGCWAGGGMASTRRVEAIVARRRCRIGDCGYVRLRAVRCC